LEYIKNVYLSLFPYTVDDQLVSKIAGNTNRENIRNAWGISVDAKVVVFCGKFIHRKRPVDLIIAFAKANIENSYLIMVGDDPLVEKLNREVRELGIEGQVRFLGFVKYSELPEVYVSSDILVHPAEWEPYGLPVNEAMVCGIPVIVSDRVGAGYDLVEEGITGFSYPCGNVDALTKILQKILTDRKALKDMGAAVIVRMKTWTSRESVEAHLKAIKKIMATKQRAVK